MKKLLILTVILVFFSCNTSIKTIYVSAGADSCDNCLRIKENKEDDWILLKNSIEGFQLQEDYTYKLEVKVKGKGDSVNYKLNKIIYQEMNKSNNNQVDIAKSWVVSKIIDMDTLKKYPTMTIDIENKKISGNAGCNRYGASFTIKGNKIKIENPFATKMYCSNMDIEDAFFECLSKIEHFKIENNHLTFLSTKNEELLICTLKEN